MQALLEGFLTEAELGEALGKTQRTLRAWRQRGIGPPYIRMGQTVVYATESFRAWLKAGEQQPVRLPRSSRSKSARADRGRS
jgi:hypothetical protein